jgi:hypothetical protein
VYPWFPLDDQPTDAAILRFSDDPRKHAIGLSFLVEAVGHPVAQNEPLEFD